MVWCVQKSRSTVTTQLAPGVMCQVPINPLSLFTTRSIFLEVQCAQKSEKKFTNKKHPKKVFVQRHPLVRKNSSIIFAMIALFFSLFWAPYIVQRSSKEGKSSIFSVLFLDPWQKKEHLWEGVDWMDNIVYIVHYILCVYNIEGLLLIESIIFQIAWCVLAILRAQN